MWSNLVSGQVPKPQAPRKKVPGHPQIDFGSAPELEAREASEFRSGVGILIL